MTYSGRSCVSLKSVLKKRTSNYDKYPVDFKKSLDRIVATADQVQGRTTISTRTLQNLTEVGKEGARLLNLQKAVFAEVNKFRQKNGVSKINFERKGNEFLARIGKQTERIVKSSGGKEKTLSALGLNSYGKEFENTKVDMNFNFDDSDSSLEPSESSEESPLMGAIALEAQIVDDGPKEEEATKKKENARNIEPSLFDIISSRYRMKYLDLIPD